MLVLRNCAENYRTIAKRETLPLLKGGFCSVEEFSVILFLDFGDVLFQRYIYELRKGAVIVFCQHFCFFNQVAVYCNAYSYF